ncbi:hypothetical protein C8Q80DRAFT_1173234 [Daedaleopsis nitida]|nr:hypothetical protein C8Q80DRAFT_1173234 [Daedaleopsis nitida]
MSATSCYVLRTIWARVSRACMTSLLFSTLPNTVSGHPLSNSNTAASPLPCGAYESMHLLALVGRHNRWHCRRGFWPQVRCSVWH